MPGDDDAAQCACSAAHGGGDDDSATVTAIICLRAGSSDAGRTDDVDDCFGVGGAGRVAVFARDTGAAPCGTGDECAMRAAVDWADARRRKPGARESADGGDWRCAGTASGDLVIVVYCGAGGIGAVGVGAVVS